MAQYIFHEYVFYLLFALVIAPRITPWVLVLFFLYVQIKPNGPCDGSWCGLTETVEYLLLIPIAMILGFIFYLAINEQGGRIRKFIIQSYAGLTSSQLQKMKANEPVVLNILQRLAVSWRLGLLFYAGLWILNNGSDEISRLANKLIG
jgi:hypothetical protein